MVFYILITKKVKIKWSPSNKKHYNNLGYICTKIGNELEVNVNELTKGSNSNVEVKCDGKECKDPFLHMAWITYLKYVKEDGKYYCVSCSAKLYRNENTRLAKLKKSKSFEEWCIENNRQDVLDRWDYELNEYKPSEISYCSNKKIWFKCSMNLHNSELKNISDFVNGHEGSITCNACNSFAQWGIDNICKDFLEKYWDWEKNKNINPWKITKSCANPYVYLKCQEIDYHKSYKITCHKFVDNRRCPYCNPRKNKVHVLDSLGTLFPEVLKIWSDKNKKSPYEYSLNSGKYVWWKCSEGKHEDYYRSIHSSNSYKFRCPECINEKNESLLQEKVRLYLNELGYIILHENNCTLKCINPITKYPLHYDNEVKLNNKPLLIEVNGIQHYKITGFHTLASIKNNSTPEQELKYQKEKDKYKKEYALLHGYEFLTIPYYTDDKDETWKNLINNKINIILNN